MEIPRLDYALIQNCITIKPYPMKKKLSRSLILRLGQRDCLTSVFNLF